MLLEYIWSENLRPRSEAKPKMAEMDELSDVNLYPLRGQHCHRNIYTRQIKESKIEIFNFCCFENMNGTKTIDSN